MTVHRWLRHFGHSVTPSGSQTRDIQVPERSNPGPKDTISSEHASYVAKFPAHVGGFHVTE